MLVDINLLPKKEKRKAGGILTSIAIGAIILGLFAAGWFYYQAQLQKADQLSSELASNQDLRKVYENTYSKQEITPTDELEVAVNWAEENKKYTYLLLDHISSLLPERGFIYNFTFQSAGSVSLTVQFDTTRQAADFLNHLQSSSFFTVCELQSIQTIDLDESNEGDNNTTLPRYRANYKLDLDLNALKASDQTEEAAP